MLIWFHILYMSTIHRGMSYMGIQNIDGALINIDDKQLWYIYNYNDQLEYRIFNDQKTASDNKIIAQNLIQGFSADVNALGRIHLVCHSPSGNVFYFILMDNNGINNY